MLMWLCRSIEIISCSNLSWQIPIWHYYIDSSGNILPTSICDWFGSLKVGTFSSQSCVPTFGWSEVCSCHWPYSIKNGNAPVTHPKVGCTFCLRMVIIHLCLLFEGWIARLASGDISFDGQGEKSPLTLQN